MIEAPNRRAKLTFPYPLTLPHSNCFELVHQKKKKNALSWEVRSFLPNGNAVRENPDGSDTVEANPSPGDCSSCLRLFVQSSLLNETNSITRDFLITALSSSGVIPGSLS